MYIARTKVGNDEFTAIGASYRSAIESLERGYEVHAHQTGSTQILLRSNIVVDEFFDGDCFRNNTMIARAELVTA